MSSPIVSVEWLKSNLLDPTIKVIEISAKKGLEANYIKKHIPGSFNFWWKDLCWDNTDRQFVTPNQLAKRLGDIGISEKDTVVLYGDPVQYGTYAFWALTMAGHPNLFILDGGRNKWIKEDLPNTNSLPKTLGVSYVAQPANQSMRLGRDNIRAKLGNADRLLLDVRSPEEYSGERVMEHGQFDHGAERGGRIPGAKHLFFRELLNADDTFKSSVELKTIFEKVGATPDKVSEIVAYCRLSHRATLAWTVMTYILGYKDVKIYDGSWTEWGSIVGFPIENNLSI
jgi:thiosulfate/3-mercaptopyruvate sulfurtransferase